MVSNDDGYAEEHAAVMDFQVADRTKWREAIIAYAPLFFWLSVIFYLSSGSGSMAETSRIFGPLIQFFFPSADEAFIQIVHAAIRKSAHVAEYAVLAALASRALLKSTVGWFRDKWPLWALSLVAVVASVDEINQSFNSQRTGSIGDILLDISGGLLAVTFIWLMRRASKRNHQNGDSTSSAR